MTIMTKSRQAGIHDAGAVAENLYLYSWHKRTYIFFDSHKAEGS